MCVNYLPPKREQFRYFDVDPPSDEWRDEVWQDYAAPIILAGESVRAEAKMATFGMVPKSRIPQKVKKYTTMNARSESVGKTQSYAGAWQAGQHCLIPMYRLDCSAWTSSECLTKTWVSRKPPMSTTHAIFRRSIQHFVHTLFNRKKPGSTPKGLGLQSKLNRRQAKRVSASMD